MTDACSCGNTAHWKPYLMEEDGTVYYRCQACKGTNQASRQNRREAESLAREVQPWWDRVCRTFAPMDPLLR